MGSVVVSRKSQSMLQPLVHQIHGNFRETLDEIFGDSEILHIICPAGGMECPSAQELFGCDFPEFLLDCRKSICNLVLWEMSKNKIVSFTIFDDIIIHSMVLYVVNKLPDKGDGTCKAYYEQNFAIVDADYAQHSKIFLSQELASSYSIRNLFIDWASKDGNIIFPDNSPQRSSIDWLWKYFQSQ